MKHTAFRVTFVLMLLAGAAFRIAPLTDNRFHTDEALFATLARLIASSRDPYLAHTALLVDKPPLFYYVLSLSVISFGGREIALRLPGLLLSILSMALAARLSWQLWRSWLGAIVTTLIVACSPFAILFSPTVFSDPYYVFWLLFAAVDIARNRWGWSGILAGLALASKQSAAFFLPLVPLIGLVQMIPREGAPGRVVRRLLRFLAGFVAIMALILVWDRLRIPAASFWVAAYDVNNPGRLVRSAEVWPRASAWLAWASTFTGAVAADAVMIISMVGGVACEIASNRLTRRAAHTLIIATVLVAYLAAIWFVAFPLLDRYLLPVIYLVALLAGRGAALFVGLLRDRLSLSRVRRWLAPIVVIGMLALLLPGSLRAANGGYPVGGDHGAYAGIDRMAGYLSSRPMGTVLYVHDLSWEMEYYLFDAYVYRAYFQGPGPLADDLRDFGASPDERYLILSPQESPREIAAAAAGAGFELTPIDVGGPSALRLFRLDHRP